MESNKVFFRGSYLGFPDTFQSRISSRDRAEEPSLQCVRGTQLLSSRFSVPKMSQKWVQTRSRLEEPGTWCFQIWFILHAYSGELIQFDEHIVQLGWNHQLAKFGYSYLSGQIIATSHEFSPQNGGLGREIPLFQGNLDWWNNIIWPDLWILLLPSFFFEVVVYLHELVYLPTWMVDVYGKLDDKGLK